MNASQLATFVACSASLMLALTSTCTYSYDVFKTGIQHAKIMDDGLGLHFTSSFLAVSHR